MYYCLCWETHDDDDEHMKVIRYSNTHATGRVGAKSRQL